MNSLIEILLVEDSDADAELTLRVLQHHKLANHIFRVRDGEEALDFLLGRGDFAARPDVPHPHVVLLDLKLPKVDGLEVLRQLKTEPRTATIPVVIMTSSREERDLVDSYRLGANSFVQKPVEFEEFRTAVKQLGFYWLVINQPPAARAVS